MYHLLPKRQSSILIHTRAQVCSHWAPLHVARPFHHYSSPMRRRHEPVCHRIHRWHHPGSLVNPCGQWNVTFKRFLVFFSGCPSSRIRAVAFNEGSCIHFLHCVCMLLFRFPSPGLAGASCCGSLLTFSLKNECKCVCNFQATNQRYVL